MPDFRESVTVSTTDDAFLAVSVHRTYDSGVQYQSTLYVQPHDATATADAIERATATGGAETVQLVDGTLRLWPAERSVMLNMELDRAGGLPHGGYDTMDIGPDSVGTICAGLREHAG